MNGITFDVVWGLAMLVASLVLTYIIDELRRFFRRRRSAPNTTATVGGGLAAAGTTSLAIREATATSLAETSAPGLEGIANLPNNGVTAEQQREEPATARQAITAITSAPTPEATAPVHNEVVTQEDPAISRQVGEALTLVPSHAANSSNPATSTSPTHVLDHSQLRHRKPNVASTLASRDPQSPFPLTNRLNRSRSCKLRSLLAVVVMLLVGVLLLVVNPGTASLKGQFWNVPRQAAKVDAATGGEPEVTTLPIGLPAAPTSLHFNGIDGREVVLLFPSPRKPIFVLSPEVQKVPRAYMETWFRAVESLLMMVRSRELDLRTRNMDSVKENLFHETLGQITVEDHNTSSGDHTDYDNMNQTKMVLCGFSNVPRQTSTIDAAAKEETAVATPPVGLPVAPTSLHLDVGGQVLDWPFPSPGKPIFVLSPEVQEVSRAYTETWFQAVESLSMMVCSYGSSNAWKDRFIGLRPGQTFCFFHPGMAISADPPRSNPYPPQMG